MSKKRKLPIAAIIYISLYIFFSVSASIWWITESIIIKVNSSNSENVYNAIEVE